MTRAAERVVPSLRPPSTLPSLQNGDNLTVAEFERRYDAMPPGTRAELIQGIVYVVPPLSHGWHGLPHADLITLLGVYRADTPGVTGGDNSSIRLNTGNRPQPDAYLMIEPTCGGQAVLDDDLFIVGAPELVAEVAATSATYDLHQKLEAYRLNGVAEYMVWRTHDGHFDQFAYRNGQFHPVPLAADGVIRSVVFPGLWLDLTAMNAGNLSTALAQLHRGLAMPEHAAFVADLQRRADANG